MNKKSSLNRIIVIICISMLTKFISMSSRIIMSRSLGIDAVAIYSLINPIFVFLITLASFSLPTTISTLISRNPKNTKKVFLISILICAVINFVFIVLITFFDRFIAETLLRNIQTLYSIKLLTLVVPLTTFSSIIKGYYMGKNELILTSTSSLVEECSRFIAIIGLIGFFNSFTNEIKATFFILVLIIGEIIQTSYLLLSSGRKYLINIAKIRDIFLFNKDTFNDVFSLSLPLTLSRVITSFTYMIEPIILTNILFIYGMSSKQITLDYGIISSYVMPLLLLPNFFSLAISNYLLPNLSSLIGKKEFNKGKKLFYKILLFTFIIGLIFSLFFLFFGDFTLKLIYHVDFGQKEIKLLALPFIIYYIETPINISMHALNKSKVAFTSSLLSSLTRISLMIILSKHFKVFSFAIAMLVSCYLDVFINYLSIHNFFKRNN